MLEKFRRLKKKGSNLLKHKKRAPESAESFTVTQTEGKPTKTKKEKNIDQPEIKKKKRLSPDSNGDAQTPKTSQPEKPNESAEAAAAAAQTTKQKKLRRVHLTDQQIHEKIANLKERIAALTGHENKNKRNRLYYEISRLNKALTNPDVFKKDPIEEEKRRQQDLERRAEKKKAKKQELLDMIRLEKKYSAKIICYVCKGKGHQAKDCTQVNMEVGGVDVNTKICYNCGSTGHTLKDCRKKRKEELPFALCFVCNKVGHIARDCPENDKGLYAHGGGCFICNSVRHVARDCPDSEENRKKAEKLAQEREERENKKKEEAEGEDTKKKKKKKGEDKIKKTKKTDKESKGKKKVKKASATAEGEEGKIKKKKIKKEKSVEKKVLEPKKKIKKQVQELEPEIDMDDEY